MSPIVSAFLLAGSVMIFLAALGALKFPDTLTRIAAVTKASTLGALCFCIAGAIYFWSLETTVLLLGSSLILALGISISSHLISRSRIYESPEKHSLYLKRSDHNVDQI